MSNFKFFRKLCGGIWFKHEMTGRIPGCYGSWWDTSFYHNPSYDRIVSIEVYVKFSDQKT